MLHCSRAERARRSPRRWRNVGPIRKHDREHRAGQGQLERPPTPDVELREALGERHGQQERQQHLDPGQHDAQLLQQPVVALAQLLPVEDVVEVLAVLVGRADRRSSSFTGRMSATAVTRLVERHRRRRPGTTKIVVRPSPSSRTTVRELDALRLELGAPVGVAVVAHQRDLWCGRPPRSMRVDAELARPVEDQPRRRRRRRSATAAVDGRWSNDAVGRRRRRPTCTAASTA